MLSIFLCHCTADAPFVRRLKNRLIQYGIRVWDDEDEIRSGERLDDALSWAIDEMAYLGVILSPNAIRTKWLRQELEPALAGQLKLANIPVVPIMLRQCKLPAFLSGKRQVSFLAWSRKAEQANFDRSVSYLLKMIHVDPKDKDRWSGQKMIVFKDFQRKIEEHFSPWKIIIELFEGWEGINFIRVDEGDGTFQIYEYWSKPSYLDLLNELFRNPGEPPIVDLKFIDTNIWTDQERDQAIAEICRRHNLEIEAFWGDQNGDARKEYQEWLDNQTPISLIRAGDFGGRI